ncbi:MAG: hypothetical protein ACKV19_05885 [Verrucomicrobiales bacterium]
MELTALPMRVTGIGAVSPAGWGVQALMDAVRSPACLPIDEVQRVAGALPRRVRCVPKPVTPLEFARDPRVRRTSPITSYLAAAAFEALGAERLDDVRGGRRRVGIIAVMLNGCVSFSRRFYGEVRAHPATASPLIFPETVFNAPASHFAAMLGPGLATSTLVGDTAQFAAALDMASLWLETSEADGVLVVGAEEADWLSTEAVMLFDRRAVVAEGAGSLFLEASREPRVMVQRPLPVSPGHSRGSAARRVREAWRRSEWFAETETLLCDGLLGSARNDAAEASAFADWTGPRLSAGTCLGDGLGTRVAWQCVAAAAMVRAGEVKAAMVPAIGSSQQALGVAFLGSESPTRS